ncbi:MAG TPA: Gfo/Idh/MocA family oxidoreductase [Gemmatimonadaceae bacterium]|nr:Gfo/Idh/MocA family oxidoreductase [Gemmatimonadaceae bacterium]
MSGKLKVGVIGAGGLGYHHVRLFRDLPGVEFVGFHDARAERAEQVAKELKVRHFDSLDALLAAADAVTIVVPTPAHHAVTMRALAAGKHVLIEKPIAATLEEADEMLAAAARAGVVVQTGHVERFNRAVRAALPYIDQPGFVEINRLAPFNPRGSDVPVVLDLMIHDIDLARTVVRGGRVTELTAAGIPVITPEVDIANARLTFDTGAVANITASRVSRDRFRKLRVFQRSGYISLDLGSGDGVFYRIKKGLDMAELAASPRKLEDFMERITLKAPDGEPLKLEFESFVAAVQGKQPVAVSGEEGRDALAVALRIVQEIEKGMARWLGPDAGRRA